MTLTAGFFYLFAALTVAAGGDGHRGQEPRARRAVPDPRLLQRRRAVRAARRRVPGDDPGRRLRRRGGGAVPVRRHDARRRLRRAARRLHQECAARPDRRRHRAGRADPVFVGRGFGVGVAQHPGAAVADARPRALQHAAARPHPLHQVRLLLRGRRPHPAGRHDRRHRADAAAQGRRAAPVDRRAGGAHARRPPSRSSRCRPAARSFPRRTEARS